jgi:hypothetical protein
MQSKTKIAVGAALAIAMVAPAQALTFDTQGGFILDVNTFDWAVGNALAVGGTNTQVGDTFQVLSHATLGTFNDLGGPVADDHGLNSRYEITYVASFQEYVWDQSTFGQSYVTTGAKDANTANFFEIYYDDTPDSNMLAGAGFNDGTLIASGVILADGNGNFNINPDLTANPPAPQIGNLDQFGNVDNYPTIDTVEGQGSTGFKATVAFGMYDPNFFVNGIGDMELDFTTNNRTPFIQADPSAWFTSIANSNGAAPDQQGATVASIGTINGDAANGGPNFIFQTDASTTFKVNTVPEPSTIALFGLTLTGMGFATRRRSRKIC